MSDEEQILEVDDHSDGFSDYGSSVQSSTQSLTDTIVDYVYENGRRYHRYQEGKYLLPNDEAEQDRLDLYHHLQLLSLKGNLFVAPTGPNVQRVLDCGTGTGIWALDVGEAYPSAEVIGVDLSPIQPTWVLPNVRFEVDDLEKEWTYPKDHFDLIHSRNIAQSVRKWPQYIAQIFRSTKPGGYVEIAEAEAWVHADDDTLRGTSLQLYFDKFAESAAIIGLTAPSDEGLKAVVENAGFVDVKVHKFKQPWGGWPKKASMKEIGQIMVLLGEAGGFESYAMALFTRALGMEQEAVKELCDKAQKEILSRKVHAYQWMWHIVGKKPEADDKGKSPEA